MNGSWKQIRAHVAACLLAGAGLASNHVYGEVIHVTPGTPITIPDNIDGIYMNVVTGATGTSGGAVAGWDINPYSATAGMFNLWGPTTQTWFSAGGVIAGPYNLPPGTSVSGAAAAFFRPGGGTNLAPELVLDSDMNYFGFRFTHEGDGGTIHFGWMRLQVGAAAGTRAIVEYAYEDVADTAILIPTTTNATPTITAEPVTLTEGDAGDTFTIAQVADAEDASTTLAVSVDGGASATVNDVTVDLLAVDDSGAVTADVTAACGATDASFTLRATDSGALFAEDTLTVTVEANVAPTLSYPASSIVFGQDGTIVPDTGPGDSGTIASIEMLDAGTYTGGVAVDGVSADVDLIAAAPIGTHTLVVRITDNCAATTDAPLDLTVTVDPLDEIFKDGFDGPDAP